MEIKKRNLILCVLFSLITCGIYYIYWFIHLVNDMNTVTEDDNGKSGIVVFLLTLITCGIYGIIWRYKAGAKIDMLTGKQSSTNVVFLLLSLFGLGWVADLMIQDTLNKYAM